MSVIKIDVGTPTLEFEMGGVLVEADVSDRALMAMLEIDETPEFKQANDELERLRSLEDKDLNKDTFNELLSKAVNTYGKSYAPIFGETAFRDVYEDNKSIVATVKAFGTAMEHVEKYYEKQQNQKSNKYRKRKKK